MILNNKLLTDMLSSHGSKFNIDNWNLYAMVKSKDDLVDFFKNHGYKIVEDTNEYSILKQYIFASSINRSTVFSKVIMHPPKKMPSEYYIKFEIWNKLIEFNSIWELITGEFEENEDLVHVDCWFPTSGLTNYIIPTMTLYFIFITLLSKEEDEE